MKSRFSDVWTFSSKTISVFVPFVSAITLLPLQPSLRVTRAFITASHFHFAFCTAVAVAVGFGLIRNSRMGPANVPRHCDACRGAKVHTSEVVLGMIKELFN